MSIWVIVDYVVDLFHLFYSVPHHHEHIMLEQLYGLVRDRGEAEAGRFEFPILVRQGIGLLAFWFGVLLDSFPVVCHLLESISHSHRLPRYLSV